MTEQAIRVDESVAPDRAASLLQVANLLLSDAPLPELLKHIANILREVFAVERCEVYLLLRGVDPPEAVGSAGGDDGDFLVKCGEGVLARVCGGGASELKPGKVELDVQDRAPQSVDGYLGVPLRALDGEIIGAALLIGRRERPLAAADEDLAESIADQAAAVLDRQRRFLEMQRVQREESQLLDVMAEISRELNMDQLLRKVIEVTTEMLNAERSTLFIFDAKTDELWSRVAEGASGVIRIPSFAGIAGSSFTSGEIINIPDAYADDRFNQEIDKKTGFRTRNILCMPVTSKDGKKVGVLQVLNKRRGSFSRYDERRLHAFSVQCAIALDNAQLLEDVSNAHSYNESILKSLSNGVITLDTGRNIIKANEAARAILGHDIGKEIVGDIGDLMGARNQWVLDSIDRVAESGEQDVSVDAELALEDGEDASLNLTVVPLMDVKDDPIGSMLVMEDITREKRVKSAMNRYMAKEVVDQLVAGGETLLGGNTQIATVLFSDIREFTTISEALGARGTVSMLNDFFEDMVEVILARRGMLDKFIGDAMMAIFGVPFRGDHDADNALEAANEMIVALRALNRRRDEHGDDAIRIGIGLSTGEVVAGNIGSSKRMDYTVVGDTVNLSARLESATKFYGVSVLVSEYTVNAMTTIKGLRPLDLIRVKGRVEPVEIFESLDHHDEESFPEMAKTLSVFNTGVRLYREKEWRKAVEAFNEALLACPRDAPSKLYIARCQSYIDTPPDPEWDGVWVMEDK